MANIRSIVLVVVILLLVFVIKTIIIPNWAVIVFMDWKLIMAALADLVSEGRVAGVLEVNMF